MVQPTEASRAPQKHTDPDTLSLLDLLQFIRRNWLLVAGFGTVGGLCAALVALVLTRDTYRATATLVVVPPAISSELKPPILTVQGYQKLLESDAVIAETKRRLVDEERIPPGLVLRVGQNLSTEIFVSRRDEERELAPMLRATASAGNPESAALIANTWVAVFLDRTTELVAGTTSPAVHFVEAEFPKASDRLDGLEAAHVDSANEFQLRYNRAANLWDERITDAKAGLAAKEAEYQSETKRLLEVTAAEAGVDVRSTRLESMRLAAGEIQREQAQTESTLVQRRLEYETVLEQLAKTPEYFSLEKAITDDALWGSLETSNKKEPDWEELGNRRLLTQEINPLYTTLLGRAASLEAMVRGLEPRSEQLASRLDDLTSEIQTLEMSIAEDQARLDGLQFKRDAGLQALQEKGKLELDTMARDRKRELDSIARERDATLARLERGIAQHTALYDDLVVHFNQAFLAKAQANVEDVRLGAAAVAPERAEPRRGLVKAMTGALVGLLLGLLVAIVRDANAAMSRGV